MSMHEVPELDPAPVRRTLASPSVPLYKGAGVPKQTSSQKESEKLQLKLLKRQLAEGKEAEAPMPTYEPAAPPPPAPTERAAEVVNAQDNVAREARKRKGLLASVKAGETGTRQTLG